jgi:GT2 family glycosyltransferase
MTATIMMVTYNRLDLTKEALESIFKNTKHPFNLVIVDNGSKDGTVEYLDKTLYQKTEEHEAFLDYSIIANRENLGIAIGRNLALYEAVHKYDTEWLATIDNDVDVPAGWLTDAIEIMKSNRQYASIGVNMEGRPYRIVNLNGKAFQDKPQGNLGTAAMVFNRSLQKMLGFFNYQDYGLYGEEDADWGMRTRVLGFKLGYVQSMGKHLGEGERDQGEYREFKTESHRRNLAKFNQNVREYMARRKPIFISFEPPENLKG